MATAETARSEAAGDELAASLLDAALSYATAGFPVLPLRGKVPRIERGLHCASTDRAAVEDWWRRFPDANIGIRTGAESRLVVLDVDVPEGLASLRELEGRHGKLDTATVLTGSGGWHHYFRHPGREVRNSAGKLGPGLDVRGDGGYVVAPPSVHESGNQYKWTRPLDRLAELPGWLLEGDAHERRNGTQPKAVGTEIPEGQRNATLASLAGSMRHCGMGEAEILAALEVANRDRCRPPLDAREVARIAASVASYEPADEAEPFAVDVLSAREVCELPDPPETDMLLGPLVVAGQRLVIGAHTGEGKTTLTLAIVRAVQNGGELLGWTGRGDCRALILDAEQGLRSIKRRLREAGLDDSDDVDYVRVPDGLSLDSDDRHAAEVERVLADGGYAIVACDPLYKLHSGDSNAEREAVDLMRRFDAWRDQYGFALVLPVHCRKPLPGTKFSIHDLFGSSAYVRGAEVVLGLQRLRDGYSRLLFLKDRDGDLPIGESWGLLFDRDNGYRRDPDDGKHEPTTVEQVQELLQQTPGMTKAQLTEATGKKPRTVEQALRELAATSERPGQHGERRYSLPLDSQPPRTQLALGDEA